MGGAEGSVASRGAGPGAGEPSLRAFRWEPGSCELWRQGLVGGTGGRWLRQPQGFLLLGWKRLEVGTG